MPVSENVTILIELTGDDLPTTVPEEFGNLENTAWGKFHNMDEEPDDIFLDVFHSADSSGLLILAVVPESIQLHGTRDHLVIRIGAGGIPSGTEPDMDSGFTAESLWANPLVTQETLLDLIEFFKPDLVLIRMETSADIYSIAEFWSTRESTTCIYCPPDWNGFRGFGALCGKGLISETILGLTPSGFKATVLMTAGLDWRRAGYPAMQAFTRSEI